MPGNKVTLAYDAGTTTFTATVTRVPPSDWKVDSVVLEYILHGYIVQEEMVRKANNKFTKVLAGVAGDTYTAIANLTYLGDPEDNPRGECVP